MDKPAARDDGLRFPVADAPATGEIREISPGVGWVPMPLPFALNHINLWILRDDDGVTLVDTGISDDATRAAWNRLFDGPLKGLPVKQIVSTHYHPDHMGLAGWLVERTGAPFLATAAEWSMARFIRETPED